MTTNQNTERRGDKQSILAECRANPDKIFHILKRDGFAGAKVLWGEVVYDEGGYCIDSFQVRLEELAVIDSNEELSYVERFAGEVEK